MKILFLTSVYFPDIIGGGEISTKLITESLALRGHDIYVFALAMANKDEVINGVKIMRRYIPGISEEYMSVIKNGNTSLRRLSKLYKITYKYADLVYSKKWYNYYHSLFMERKYDVVHSVSALSYTGRYNAWKAAYDLKIPVSHISRSPELLEFQFLNGRLNNIYREFNARAARLLTALVAPSKYMLRCHENSGIKANNMLVIYNATEIADKKLRKNISYFEKSDRVIYAGDIRREKGVLTLYEAIKGLKNVELELVGKGDLLEFFLSKEDVKTPGWLSQKDLYLEMQYSKIFVLPSEWNEAFGRVLIEAIANGTIAIGSDKGGIPEVLNFNEEYIFKAGDIKELQKKIVRILSLNEYEYKEEIRKQQSLLDAYTMNTYIDKWEHFFINQLGE